MVAFKRKTIEKVLGSAESMCTFVEMSQWIELVPAVNSMDRDPLYTDAILEDPRLENIKLTRIDGVIWHTTMRMAYLRKHEADERNLYGKGWIASPKARSRGGN